MEVNKQENKAEDKPEKEVHKFAETELKYSKNDFLNSEEYDKVLIKTILDDGKEYTKTEVSNLIQKFKRGGF